MDYGMIGKIEKARRYAREPQRVTLHTMTADFMGDNSTYTLHLTPEGLECSCSGYRTYHICPHVMTIERLLKPMLKRAPLPYGAGQNRVSDVEKAARYAAEPDRIRVRALTATFAGDNGEYALHDDGGTWACECDFFRTRGVCGHTMAMERLFGEMLRVPAAAVTG